MYRRRELLLACAAWLATSTGSPALPDPLARVPAIVLWAWERPEDLRFLDTDGVGVAYLDRTITLRGSTVVERPRQQPLRVQASTALIAVVRIEADADAGRLADATRVAEVVARGAQRPGLKALQVDFDAMASQRELYRRVIHELRHALPPGLPLSITALASWCADDRWLEELPVDEAVPMLFRMGVDRDVIAARLRGGEPFGSMRCRGVIGTSIDEPLRRRPSFNRAYVFNPRPWTEEAATAAIRELQTLR